MTACVCTHTIERHAYAAGNGNHSGCMDCGCLHYHVDLRRTTRRQDDRRAEERRLHDRRTGEETTKNADAS